MNTRTQGKMIKITRDTRKTREEGQNVAAPGKKNVKGEDVRPRRAAFGDITNATQKNAANGKKEAGKKAVQLKVAEPKAKPAATKPKQTVGAQGQRKKTAPAQASAASKAKDRKNGAAVESEVTSSQESSSQESTVSSSQESAASSEAANISDIIMADLDISCDDANHSRMSLDKSIHESTDSNQGEMPEVPVDAGVEDIDHDDLNDITLVALYAYDIFNYYKAREGTFKVRPYLDKQPQFTQRMRAVLVDWLVEVQENFELNHETLYLAVKLFDTYMSIVPDVPRDNIQLLGSVALFLASKFDERLPPAIDDFLYVCDYAYQQDQFLAMERELFRVVDFDLGRPIAYRFLRRYARCAKAHTKTLYLARYLLELSLMDYRCVFHRESMMAASCLYIARRMREEGGWNPTLEFYTGYKLEELHSLILELNPLFTSKKQADLITIRDKYKHYLFHSVGDIPPITEKELFPTEEASPAGDEQ